MISSRDDIKNFVLEIERGFPVNTWKYKDIHLWPVIRLELFFHIRKELYHQKPKAAAAVIETKKKRVSLLSRLANKLKLIRDARKYSDFIHGLKKKQFVFVAHNNHRIQYQGKNYNRFFDPLISENKLEGNSWFIEMGNKETGSLTNPDIIISHKEVLENYKAHLAIKKEKHKESDPDFQLEGYTQLLDFLNQQEVTRSFARKFVPALLQKKIRNEYLLNFDLYTEVFKAIAPKKIIALCYYSDMGMIAAANRLNIETIDMQHGAQNPAHLAYGSWSRLPAEGYDFLPRSYWNWDEQSKHTIAQWTENSRLYKAWVGGNVWMEYWMNRDDKYSSANFVLYTLQPDSLSLDELFPGPLMHSIKTGKRKWFIRLHPRQIGEKQKIKDFLQQNGLSEFINIDDATKDPLPLLLKNCSIHVTNSSASTIEAAMFGKKTVLLHEVGRSYYAELIADGKAVYMEPNRLFEENFEKEMNAVANEALKKGEPHSHKLVFS